MTNKDNANNQTAINADPYIVKGLKSRWGYFAKTAEWMDEFATSKGIKKAYDRGYRAGRKQL